MVIARPANPPGQERLKRASSAPGKFGLIAANDSHTGLATADADNYLFGYATYGRGTKSQGVNVTALPAGVSPVVKPERLNSYELGLKSAWFGHRLTANAAAFWIEDNNYQGVVAAPLNASGTVFTSFAANVPKIISRGFEIDTSARLVDWLTLTLSGAFTDAFYDSYRRGQCPVELVGSATRVCDLTGKSVPGTSRFIMNAGGEVNQNIGRLGRFDLQGYAGADFTLRSKYNVSANDSIYAEIPGYGLLNLRLGVRTLDGKYDLFLWGRNATNTRYYTVRGAGGPFSGLLVGNLGDPALFGATFRAKL